MMFMTQNVMLFLQLIGNKLPNVEKNSYANFMNLVVHFTPRDLFRILLLNHIFNTYHRRKCVLSYIHTLIVTVIMMKLGVSQCMVLQFTVNNNIPQLKLLSFSSRSPFHFFLCRQMPYRNTWIYLCQVMARSWVVLIGISRQKSTLPQVVLCSKLWFLNQ